MRTRRVWRRTLSASFWLFIGGLACTAQDAPPGVASSSAVDVRKPAPDPATRTDQQRFKALIKVRYPDLITKTAQGVPIVTVLFDPQGEIVRTDLEISSTPPSELSASESSFNRFGAQADDLGYIGAASIDFPANTVLVVFAGTRNANQALVQRFFPEVFEKGRSLSGGIWILLDHDGQVLRTGQESIKFGHLRQILEKRYPGIQTSDMTATPVVGRDGQPIRDMLGQPFQLYCVWLAADSALPR
jgi:hypothetical protein